MKIFSNFTKRQWLTLVVFSIADFCNAICVSLQAPFYPKEAEDKGASATEYGLVFGIFELVVFIISPIYGQRLNQIGPKYLFNGGIFTTGICAILFGLLHYVQGHYPFIILSFVIRIIEALGNAAFLTASFAIIAKEFPDNIATTFASLETFFGLGLIVGPTLGGALYQVGGFTTPFVTLGFLLFLSAAMTALVLPDHPEKDVNASHGSSLLQVLKIPGVFLAACSIIVTSSSIGFLSATLEPHLRASKFELSPIQLGLMFVINGGTYAVTAPCWGWVCDKLVSPKIITVLGSILLMISFCLIGPAPFLNLQTKLGITILGLVIHGLGIGTCLVASFTDALRTAIAHGFPNNLETYGLISGLWTSTFALGAFIGPSVGGFLMDRFKFPNATMFIVISSCVVGLVTAIFICCSNRRPNLYKQVDSFDDFSSHKFNHSGTLHEGSSTNRLGGSGPSPCPERPPGMTAGLIPSNSYKNRLGTWNLKETATVIGAKYSSSYGSNLETRSLLGSTA
ncbi:unnamed protein product [Bemisia tabaci]|uniref:Major facilitator superfamily (MFS) profile domain-containing protein n=1 Tax=Bemisia tabaci TaxID=7038 RepID=A0A9P0AKN5_BEMTA|nr:PREDICTED: MFS-type transporter SLC18B1-like [Bemisia tabaci]CAH0393352.1 unnamed protein product [Bemisia tabaci]